MYPRPPFDPSAPAQGGRPLSGPRPGPDRGARPSFRPGPNAAYGSPPRSASGRAGLPPPDALGPDEELVAGRRPVEEAFVARRGARRLLVVPQRRQALEKIVLHATNLRIPIVEVEGGSLTALAGFDGHQGVALVVEPRKFATIDDVLARAAERGEPPLILVLDSLEDPHNVGSLLRSAEGAGVHGVLFPVKRQAPLTPSAIKASAGAVEHLLLCPVDDLASALVDLHSHGIWVAGADGDAPLTARQTDLRGPIAIVVGSEGQGLGPAVRKRCDLFVRIPLKGAIGSLNAAVAGSVLLFEVAAQRDPDGTSARPAARNVRSADEPLLSPAVVEAAAMEVTEPETVETIETTETTEATEIDQTPAKVASASATRTAARREPVRASAVEPVKPVRQRTAIATAKAAATPKVKAAPEPVVVPEPEPEPVPEPVDESAVKPVRTVKTKTAPKPSKATTTTAATPARKSGSVKAKTAPKTSKTNSTAPGAAEASRAPTLNTKARAHTKPKAKAKAKAKPPAPAKPAAAKPTTTAKPKTAKSKGKQSGKTDRAAKTATHDDDEDALLP